MVEQSTGELRSKYPFKTIGRVVSKVAFTLGFIEAAESISLLLNRDYVGAGIASVYAAPLLVPGVIGLKSNISVLDRANDELYTGVTVLGIGGALFNGSMSAYHLSQGNVELGLTHLSIAVVSGLGAFAASSHQTGGEGTIAHTPN